MSKGTLNGLPIAIARRVPWLPQDDGMVRTLAAARAEVLTEGGGRFNALVYGRYAFAWERLPGGIVSAQGAFRAIELDAPGDNAAYHSGLVAARPSMVMEPDARFTMAGTRTVPGANGNAPRMLVTVETRRGIGEALQVTVEGHELMRMVNALSGLVLWGERVE